MQATGSYQGFKLRSYYEFGNGVKDKIEQWNYSRNFDQEIPSVLKPYFKQVRDFADKTHNLVLFNVLRRELVVWGIEVTPTPSIRDCAGGAFGDACGRAQVPRPRRGVHAM